MATFTANTPELLSTLEKDIFFKRFTQQPQKFRDLFSVKTSKKAYEDRLRVAGLGTFQVKPEGTPVAFSDPVEGTRRRVIHTTYALGFRVTMESYADDQWDIIKQMPADLGDSGRDHQERIAWDLINDGYAGNRHTGLDGLSLFNTAHTRLRPELGTQSNALSPPVELSITGLETIMTLAMTTQSEEGRYVDLEMGTLVIEPTEQHNAYVLLETTMKSGSADNDVSTVVSSRSGLTPLPTPFKTSTRSWSIHASSAKNSLVWNDRETMDFDRARDDNTFDMKFYAYYRASVMFSEWRNNWGSNFS